VPIIEVRVSSIQTSPDKKHSIMQQETIFAELVFRHLTNTISRKERKILTIELNSSPQKQRLFEKMTNPAWLRNALKKAKSYDKKAALEKLKKKLDLP